MLEFGGDQPGIGHQPIDERGTRGAGIAEIEQLQRRRPQGQHRRTSLVGVAHQIHQHIDAVVADQLRQGLAAQLADIAQALAAAGH